MARLGAEIAVHHHDGRRAVTLARQAVPAKSRDYREQLWLAQIQWLAGQPLEAEETLRQAVASAPRIPEVWVALVEYLVRTQQPLQMQAAVEAMAKKLPADRAPAALARCLEAAGRHDQAEEIYKKALAEDPLDLVLLRQMADFCVRSDQPAKAKSYLRSLLDPATMAPPDLVHWARRQLALVLALAGDPGDFQEALALLDKNATPQGLQVEDQRIRAFVLARRPLHRAEAVQLFEQTLLKKSLTPAEQFLLAQVYDANRDDAKAKSTIQALLVFHADKAQYLAYFIRLLLERGDIDAARLYLAALERLEPDSWRTQQLRVALHKT
jgi:Tfp pilus assembly protein PilF